MNFQPWRENNAVNSGYYFYLVSILQCIVVQRGQEPVYFHYIFGLENLYIVERNPGKI
jgi:hypothetical protein